MDEESIKSQLDKSRQPEWVDARLKAISRLSRSKKDELRALITKKPNRYGGYYFDGSAEQVERTNALFDSLNEKQTERLWKGLFPELMPYVQQAWDHAKERVYQAGYGQSPFRAPRREPIARMNRAGFFLGVCRALHGLNPSPAWLAAHAGYIESHFYGGHPVPWVLASVLRSGGDDADQVRSIIIDSINGDHEVGRMSKHAIATLLNSDERSDWEFIGKLLLAAQRQEGLRQSILETVDEANPDAFRYLLGLILEHDLARFSSVVRAFDTWLGYQWAGGSAKVVHEGIATICRFFDDDAARSGAIESGEPEETFLALWVTAFRDVDAGLRAVSRVVTSPDPARRYAALSVLWRSQLLPEVIDIPASMLLEGQESDEHVLTMICAMFSQVDCRAAGYKVSDELFDAVAQIFHQFPVKKKPLESLIWPWDKFVCERRAAAEALASLAGDKPQRMLPFADALEPHACARVIRQIAGMVTPWEERSDPSKAKQRRIMSADERAFVVRMMADVRGEVYETAFAALRGSEVTEDEVELLKSNLHRTAASFRSEAIERLRLLPPTRLLALGEELVEGGQAKKQSAGLELLQSLVDDKKHGPKVKEIAERHRERLSARPELDATIKIMLGESGEQASLDDGLGLVEPGSRCTPIKLKAGSSPLQTKAATRCLTALAKLLLEYGETEIERPASQYTPGAGGERVHLSSHFPYPFRLHKVTDEREQILSSMPLREVWQRWVEDRDESLRDPDGLEFTRAWALVHLGWGDWQKSLPREYSERGSWGLQGAFRNLVDWLPLLQPQNGAVAMLVQATEDLIAQYEPEPEKELVRPGLGYGSSKQSQAVDRVHSFLRFAHLVDSSHTDEVLARFAALRMIAMEKGIPDCKSGPSIEQFCIAYDAGLLNEHDFVMLLLKDRTAEQDWYRYAHHRFGPIDLVTRMAPHELLVGRHALAEKAVQLRERLLEVELARGEQPTAASGPSTLLRFAGGAEVLFRVVGAFGKDKIVRQDQWGDPTRAYSFSRLISVTVPLEGDTDERFAELIEQHGIKTKQLLEIGMYAPQWAGHIERATGQVGFEDAVWWIHAHTKGSETWNASEIRDLWVAQISERTELDSEDLEQGAVDVAWFRRLIDRIGEDAWEKYQKPAKYASALGGHKRAQLFANAMLGRVTREQILERIDQKRNQDAVRALGLLPLPKDRDAATKQTLGVYTRLQEFLRESRKGGSQRQASEGRAVEIAMQNLARNAGYRDPQRLQWAMEREAVADLAKGPVTVEVDETAVSLALDEEGAPEFTVIKKGRRLKNVPAKLRKHAEISELKARVTDLRRQASRMRLSLEESMCRGDVFSGAELGEFMAHPMLRPMVERLVFVSANEAESLLCGYPHLEGGVLRSFNQSAEPVGSKDQLRIAHPSDLFARGDWHDWQRECFESERVQPFKQVFRELYPKTAAESGDADLSKRYAGHQVNPRQALALFKKRQWVFAPEEGCRRVYHDQGLVAELWFEEHFYTPADIEGLTLAGVAFRKKDSHFGHEPLSSIPDRIFSETMRDLDLVASVAHAGGVDPEASESTVEMRASLLRETCRLLDLKNVEVEGHHAMIEGTKARYSVHLGSASTRVMPGRMLTIVAVHSQYRGRLFLPFADEDPRTAEVLAKTLLLARDKEIKDPSILEQIYGNS